MNKNKKQQTPPNKILTKLILPTALLPTLANSLFVASERWNGLTCGQAPSLGRWVDAHYFGSEGPDLPVECAPQPGNPGKWIRRAVEAVLDVNGSVYKHNFSTSVCSVSNCSVENCTRGQVIKLPSCVDHPLLQMSTAWELHTKLPHPDNEEVEYQL